MRSAARRGDLLRAGAGSSAPRPRVLPFVAVFVERRDYLIDMIQQIMERIVAILQRSQGREVDLAELEQDCERAMDDEFAELDRRMRDVEPRMIAHLVQPVERLRAYALLVAARALLAARRAELSTDADADALEAQARHALCLVLEVTLRVEPTATELDALRQLFGRIDMARISARHLRAVVALAPE